MHIVRNTFVCVLSALAVVGHAQTSPEQKTSLLAAVARVQDGVPPVNDGRRIEKLVSELQVSLAKLHAVLDAETARGIERTANCTRFLNTSRRLLGSLQSEVGEPARLDFMQANHLQIAVFAFSDLNLLLSSGAEAGFGTLARSLKQTCDIEDRKSLVAAFDGALVGLSEFLRLGFGIPGVKQLNETQDKLLEAAIEDEDVASRNRWLVVGVGTAASIVTWEFAPAAAALAVRTMWGYTPQLFAVPAVLYGVKSSALAAEGIAFAYATDVAGQKAEPVKIKLGAWDEHLSTVERFLDSPVRSPELQLALMGRVQSLTLSDVAPWIVVQAQYIQGAELARGILQSWEIATMLKGLGVDDQIVRLGKYVEEKFRFRLECGTSWGMRIDSARCLLGMRAVSQALVSGEAPVPPEVVVVRISPEGKWRKFDENERVPTVYLPYTAKPSSFQRFVSAQLASPKYKRQVELRGHLEDLRARVQEKLNKLIEIQDNVPDEQAQTALIKLNLIADDSPGLFEGNAGTLKISDRFAFPYEENLRLKEDIDASAPVAKILDFLTSAERRQRNFLGDLNWPQSFFNDRRSLALAEVDLKRNSGIPAVDCEAETMMLKGCTLAVRRIELLLRSKRVVPPKIDLLMIVEPWEVNGVADYYVDPETQKTVLIVAQGFALRSMQQWFQETGWVQK